MFETNYKQYGILAGNNVIANSGNTSIFGSLGSFNSVTGSGTIIASDQNNTGVTLNDALTNAQSDYNSFISLPPNTTSSATDIGGTTFTPGIYQFTSSNVTFGTVAGNNTITLNGNGAYFFQFPNGNFSTNSTLASISINLINGAKSSQTYWLISGNANFSGTANITSFLGLVICQGNITLSSSSTSLGTMTAPFSTGVITLNNNNITATSVQEPRDNSTSNYINIESTLADNEAITIAASNNAGGIDIDAGLGGINIETTNSISLNAAAASNFTTSNGNLILQATTGLLNVDGGSGINIGNSSTSTPIDIGTSSNSKIIGIGNLTGITQVDLNSGTGGINANTSAGGAISLNANGALSNFTVNSTAAGQDLILALTGANASRILLSSQGTGTDSIFLNTSAGGLTNSITGPIDFVSSSSSSAAFNIDTTTNNGGISMVSGNQGTVINSINGTIGIGNFDADSILLGTAGPNTITIGNNTTSTILFNRFGTGGFIKTQEAETALSNANATLTISQLLQTIFTITPTTTNITLTLDSAANAVAGISGVQINDSIDFIIINESTALNGASVIISPGAGGSLTGNATIASFSNATGAYFSSGSGIFRMRFTNVTSGSQAYTVYRIA